MTTERVLKMSDTSRECGNCHMKFSEFEATGLLGCAACYDEFREDIDRVLAQQNGAAVYAGKRRPVATDAKADVKQLTEELSDAIKREEFELAARIRDRIRSCSKTGSGPR